MISVAHMKELRNQHRMLIGNPEGQAPFTINGRQNKMAMSYTAAHRIQGRIKLFGAPRQWKHFRPLFQALFLSGGGITPQTESNTTPTSPKTEITDILFCILNFASIIKFKMQLFFNILPQQEIKIKNHGTLPSIKIPIYIHWISLCKWMEGGGSNK